MKFSQTPDLTITLLVAAMSGARRGELLGLKWKDIDWRNKQVRIRRTYNTRCWFKPKTKASKREIDLGASMINELKKWRLACLPSELGLVFPNKNGLPIEPANLLRRHFNPALIKAELKKIRFYDLRHFKASLMIKNGEGIKYVQNQLGHSKPSVTLDIYSHLMESKNQEAADRFEKAILG